MKSQTKKQAIKMISVFLAAIALATIMACKNDLTSNVISLKELTDNTEQFEGTPRTLITYNVLEMLFKYNFQDTSPYLTHGIGINSPTFVPGIVDTSFRFSDTSAFYIPASGSLNFGQGDFSFSFWIKTTDYNGSIFKKYSTADGIGIELLIVVGRLKLILDDYNSPKLTLPPTTTGTIISDGNWHSIIVTVARASTTGVNFYLDGGSPYYVGDPTSIQDSISTAVRSDFGDYSNTLTADFDELRIFKKILTAVERTTLSTLVPVDYEAYWKMDETSGTIVSDSSGNGHHGIKLGSSSAFVPGYINNGLQLYPPPGSNYVTIGTKNFGALPGLTITMWLKTSDTGPNRYLFGGWQTVGVQFSMSIGIPGKIEMWHSTMGRISSYRSVNNGIWHHIVWRYIKNNTFAIYIDGQKEAEGYVGTITWDNWNWEINSSGNANSSGLNGIYDEVRIYTRALTDAQIRALYDYNHY